MARSRGEGGREERRERGKEGVGGETEGVGRREEEGGGRNKERWRKGMREEEKVSSRYQFHCVVCRCSEEDWKVEISTCMNTQHADRLWWFSPTSHIFNF